jgi:adenylate cyclase
LRAAGAIEGVISDLNTRLGRRRDARLKAVIAVHAGRAAVGEIGSSDPPRLMAVGEAIDVVNEIRGVTAQRGAAFGISEEVYAAAGLNRPAGDEIVVGTPPNVTRVLLSEAAPVSSPAWTLHGEIGGRAMLKRLLAG